VQASRSRFIARSAEYRPHHREQFEDKPSEDLLIGGQAVGKAHSDKIQMMGQAALRRKKVLETLIEYLNDLPNNDARLDDLRMFSPVNEVS
jgi:hypothetical protein